MHDQLNITLAADATSLRTTLASRNTSLHPIPQNLIDKIWTARPARTANPIAPLSLKYAGAGAKDKLEMVRKKIERARAAGLVVSLLDEVAWLVGMRGGDIDYNPGTYRFVLLVMAEYLLGAFPSILRICARHAGACDTLCKLFPTNSRGREEPQRGGMGDRAI